MIFIQCTDKKGSAYFEFQYCKGKPTKNHGRFWLGDSLLVHIDNEEIFFDNYFRYFDSPKEGKFNYYGPNYYTKEQTEDILQKVREDKPQEHDTVCTWLEKAATEYNGFYILGI